MQIYLAILLLLIPFPSSAILYPGDFLALQSIRKSLKDLPGSHFFLSWDFTSDPCNFSGVLCSGDRVTSLSLGDPAAGSPGLAGFLHPSLGRLSALRELSLLPGRVSGSIPPTIFHLSDLHFLAISHNFISGKIPPAISSLAQLRTLDLSFNQLSGSLPPQLSALPRLKNLLLAHNHLSGNIPALSSPELSRLDLSHNNLSGSLSSLPLSLKYLSLSWNKLSGEVGPLLPQLRQLKTLDLSFNQFTGHLPSAVFSLPLNELRLQRNLFTGGLLPEREVTIPIVDLSYNRLRGRIPRSLAAARRLYLNNNRFFGEVPREYVQRLMEGKMETLYLQHNFLRRIEIEAWEELPRSSSLCLQYNCMVPPVQTVCPRRAGVEKIRPASQCIEWGG